MASLERALVNDSSCSCQFWNIESFFKVASLENKWIKIELRNNFCLLNNCCPQKVVFTRQCMFIIIATANERALVNDSSCSCQFWNIESFFKVASLENKWIKIELLNNFCL